MIETCPACKAALKAVAVGIRDFEYGVPREAVLMECTGCGLVVQLPPVTQDEVPKLYPANYMAHTPAASGRGVYGRLKTLLGRRNAQKVARYLPEKGAFLEIGCGNGSFLSAVATVRPQAQLSGVDIVRVAGADFKNFTFYQGQMEQVDIPANSMDVIYHSNLVEHVPDPSVFLAKCQAALKPGGIMIGVTPDHLSLDRYIFGKYWAGYHYPRHTVVFNHENIRHFLDAAGFEAVSIKGSYGCWYLSLANMLLELPGTKKRGLAFAAVTALFLPLDWLINRVRPQGSMTFIARKKSSF